MRLDGVYISGLIKSTHLENCAWRNGLSDKSIVTLSLFINTQQGYRIVYFVRLGLPKFQFYINITNFSIFCFGLLMVH